MGHCGSLVRICAVGMCVNHVIVVNNDFLLMSGELNFQRNLQQRNLPAFIALLAKNGVKYNPNYRRGT